LKAHGVPELRAHLRGAMSLADAIDRAVLNTSQYAKRQITWARHQIVSDKELTTIDSDRMLDLEKFLDKITH
jgi:tRNA dimethylallyltransferase